MTSQIAIINGFGVALASDSAMTLGETRIYDTAEKMVPLPLPHRIAVMHAGRVRIGNLPYSVLVSEWARQLGNKALRSADAYAKSFQDWLSNNPQWFPVNPQQSDALSFIESRADAIVGHYQANRENDENYQFADLLSRWTSEVQELPRLEGMTAVAALATFEKHKDQIEELLNEYLAPVVGPDYPKDSFLNYCAEFFSSSWMTNATLTFAGYGEQEIYASYVSIRFHGFVDGRLSWIKGDSYALSPETNPLMAISLPAQRDAIDQYLKGYDTQMIDEIIERSDQERYELLNSIREKFEGDDQLLEKLDKAVEETLAQFETQLPHTAGEYSERNYLVSLRRALAALPAASLVEVARSLIELQALRKTTTAQADTVGGPIDVALITPTDGFVWIRHKSIS
jgi:hypothetical protein